MKRPSTIVHVRFDYETYGALRAFAKKEQRTIHNAVQLLVKVAFNALELHRLQCEIEGLNINISTLQRFYGR